MVDLRAMSDNELIAKVHDKWPLTVDEFRERNTAALVLELCRRLKRCNGEWLQLLRQTREREKGLQTVLDAALARASAAERECERLREDIAEAKSYGVAEYAHGVLGMLDIENAPPRRRDSHGAIEDVAHRIHELAAQRDAALARVETARREERLAIAAYLRDLGNQTGGPYDNTHMAAECIEAEHHAPYRVGATEKEP